MTRTRIAHVRKLLEDLDLDAFLVSHLPNIRYLSGFTGSNAFLILSLRRQILVTDSRYREQSRNEARGFQIVVSDNSLVDAMARKSLFSRRRRVGFEAHCLPYASYGNLKKLFPGTKFVPKFNLVESIAAVKEASEVAAIREAISISDRVFQEILDFIKPGLRELDVAAEISYRQRKAGAERDAFDVIVASGWRSALPHGKATAKRIRPGELVTLDFGCSVRGYHSDLTRTIGVGSPSRRAREVYPVVLEAQERAIAAARSGMPARNLDEVARSFIRSRGFGKFFGHSLGHGLGLQVHELPKVSALSTDTLCAGNVITIEPGIYIPRLGGVRIEDDVLIKNGSCVVLTSAPKEFIVI